MSQAAVLAGSTMATPVAMAYAFFVTLVERSYYMVFWAREKIKREIEQAKANARAEGFKRGQAHEITQAVALGIAQGTANAHQEWRAWYQRMQAAQQEGRPFDEPPPSMAENQNGRQD